MGQVLTAKLTLVRRKVQNQETKSILTKILKMPN